MRTTWFLVALLFFGAAVFGKPQQPQGRIFGGLGSLLFGGLRQGFGGGYGYPGYPGFGYGYPGYGYGFGGPGVGFGSPGIGIGYPGIGIGYPGGFPGYG